LKRLRAALFAAAAFGVAFGGFVFAAADTARAADAEKATACPICGKPVQSDWNFCPYDATRLGKGAGDAMKEGSIPAIRQDPAKQIGRTIVLTNVHVLSINQNNNEYAGPYKTYLGCDILAGDKRIDSANLLIPDSLADAVGKLTGEKHAKLTGSFRGLDNDYQTSLLIEAQAIEPLP